MKKDNLGNRMKGYESITRNYLMRRNPVIIRLDGKAFHSFTKGFEKPFDKILIETMQETAKELCNQIQGCKLAYVQSDEISLLLTDYEKIDSCAWFDNNIQKMTSVSSSIATLAFNKVFSKLAGDYVYCLENYRCSADEEYIFDKYGVELYTNKDGECCVPNHIGKLKETYKKRIMTALFDSRVFSIPKEEVCNYFIWRQQDATRNAIQMVGQANFSHKQLHNKSCNQIQEMLFQEKSINFNNLPISQKRGACVVKEQYKKEDVIRNKWIVDLNIPIFTQDRQYIEKYV